MKLRTRSLALTSLAAVLLAGSLAGCAPLIVAGAAGTALMVTDRRTSGAQIDDEAIELRSAARLRENFGDDARLNITSYNRQVLLTGEVPNEAARQRAGQIVSSVDNVRGIVNELAVMPTANIGTRSNDVLITGKVRASFVDASDLQAQAFKVVTERGVVYLMGRVSEREAERATSIARGVGGVQKVVRIFEPVNAVDLPRAATVAPAPAPAPAAPFRTEPGGAVVSPVR